MAPLVAGFGVGGGWWTLMVEIIWHPEKRKIDIRLMYCSGEWAVEKSGQLPTFYILKSLNILG